MIHIRSWEDLKIFEVTVSHLVPTFTKEEAIKHIEETSFPNQILEVKELSSKKRLKIPDCLRLSFFKKK